MTGKIVLGIAASAIAVFGQFNSGSTGADGALNFTTPGTVDFDPAALNLNPAGDNIFNFTTINIAAGVTVRLRASKVRNLPVVWLASGSVTIAGTLDLSGAAGNPSNQPRTPAEPGPGGWAGGIGGRAGSVGSNGAGPGGGGFAAGGFCGIGCGGSHGTSSLCGTPAYGTVLLIPLRGGSGGGGGTAASNNAGGNGGAGGGALQLASSGTITVTGSIIADGGTGDPGASGCSGGGGSGGGIHIQSQSFTGSGVVRALGWPSPCPSAGAANVCSAPGRIRIDTSANTFTGAINPAATFGTPFNTPLPNLAPVVKLVSVNGVAVPPNPTGSFVAPDVTINAPGAVTINIAAANIPLGTIVKLYLASETGTDQVITCTGLAGSVAASTATCSSVFPLGTTATFARAVW